MGLMDHCHLLRWRVGKSPPYDDEYIVTCKGAQKAMNLTYEKGKWKNSEGVEFEVIAWMPFPPAYDATNDL